MELFRKNKHFDEISTYENHKIGCKEAVFSAQSATVDITTHSHLGLKRKTIINYLRANKTQCKQKIM